MRILGLIVFLLAAGWASAQIRVSAPVHDLGDIFEQGGKVTTKFELQNPYYKDTIRILDINTSCGCTVVLTEDTLLPPRSSMLLDVTYDPAGRLGLFVKSVELTTKTGDFEINKLFLKIVGNVVAENFKAQEKKQELLTYQVAPLYFYPVTAYDTAYLGYNYINNFIDDLTYEIDFYQFTTLGFEIELQPFTDLEKMEYLIGFLQRKMTREFKRRGFNESTVFFAEPIFKKATDLPIWAGASIRLFSVNFDAGSERETVVELATDKTIEETKILLDYERFALPEVESVLEQVNFENIEGKLFLNGQLELGGTILMPWKKSDKVREKYAKNLEKAIRKKIKETTGAGKNEIHLAFDSLGVHPQDKYRFIMWDQADLNEKETIQYVEKEDEIVAPFLPTYRQTYGDEPKIDTSDQRFKHFIENCRLNQRAGKTPHFVIESCFSDAEVEAFRNIEKARDWAEQIKKQLIESIGLEQDRSIQIEIKPRTHNPLYELAKNKDNSLELAEQNYFNIIPVLHNDPELTVQPSKPYMVNFDYFFKGVDIGAWGFQRFLNYLVTTIQKDGFVELRIESSISKIPMEHASSNLSLAHKRLIESEVRIRKALAQRLVDPNRLIFKDERIVVQGPVYDGTVPILKYRDYQYLRLIPEKTLK